MARLLRAERYLTKRNERLARFITEDLFTLDYEETTTFYSTMIKKGVDNNGLALMGCNDRYFLLTGLCRRKDLLHPWLFDRCREVEADPDGYLDLWARAHYKSTIITFGGVIQDVLVNPEIKCAIFSVTKPIAQAFLQQIKDEFESNDFLKEVYSDVLYQDPKKEGPDGKPSKWGIARGITVKRKGNPKEATIEAHGLIDGQPTSRHFDKHAYDDVVTQDYTEPDQIRKCTMRFEMADNLGTHHGCRKQVAGTYYSYNDTYVQMGDRKSFKLRIYPATHNGKLDGKPVLLSQERWEEIKRIQRSTVATQMLLNPSSTGDNSFDITNIRGFDVFPACMNVYILCDPSKGRGERSDRSAIPVIGIDQGGNKYLLDGVRHRMRLSERWAWIKAFHAKWSNHPGVQMVRVGYEQYGMQSDLEVIAEYMQREKIFFEIVELATPSSGGHSKDDRISRLEPDINSGRFYTPSLVWHPDHGGAAYWGIWTKLHEEKAAEKNLLHNYRVGQVFFRESKGHTGRAKQMMTTFQSHRVVEPIARRDERKDVYDLTRVFLEELGNHPFGAHDDLIDAISRIYDMEPIPATPIEAQNTEPIGQEDNQEWTV